MDLTQVSCMEWRLNGELFEEMFRGRDAIPYIGEFTFCPCPRSIGDTRGQEKSSVQKKVGHLI